MAYKKKNVGEGTVFRYTVEMNLLSLMCNYNPQLNARYITSINSSTFKRVKAQ
jgi:hypothetical protein